MEKFLADFGLEAEFSCHSNIRGLSGEAGVVCLMVCWEGVFDQREGSRKGGRERERERVVFILIRQHQHVPFPLLSHMTPGGQKVKLVLAAAMWNSPHLLIMDEPTNYLDRWAI